MRQLAHIINPFDAPKGSTISFAQPVTFRTMELARRMAEPIVDVDLYYTTFSGETVSLPDCFQAVRDLDRSVIDIIPQAKRRLPLLQDILDRLYEVSDAEYFIYTNADIAVMPTFYEAVNALIEEGYDAFAINRRTIPGDRLQVLNFPLLFAHAGIRHAGHDCFVFKRSAYPAYRFHEACIGQPPVGKVLLCNLVYNAYKFEVFVDFHLTFHIGKDVGWNYAEHKGLWWHNYRALEQVVRYYEDANVKAPHPIMSDMLAKQRLFLIEKQRFFKRTINRVTSKLFSTLILHE